MQKLSHKPDLKESGLFFSAVPVSILLSSTLPYIVACLASRQRERGGRDVGETDQITEAEAHTSSFREDKCFCSECCLKTPVKDHVLFKETVSAQLWLVFFCPAIFLYLYFL